MISTVWCEFLKLPCISLQVIVWLYWCFGYVLVDIVVMYWLLFLSMLFGGCGFIAVGAVTLKLHYFCRCSLC